MPEAPLTPNNAATILSVLPAAAAIVKGGSPTTAGFQAVADELLDARARIELRPRSNVMARPIAPT